jgi:hypothetical protein
LLPERYPRLRIVAILPSILSTVVYFATSEGAANGIHFRAVVNPYALEKYWISSLPAGGYIPCLFQARQNERRAGRDEVLLTKTV